MRNTPSAKPKSPTRLTINAFLPASAAESLKNQKPRHVVFACAGHHGHFCLEDAVCSGYIINQIPGVQFNNDGAVASKWLSRQWNKREKSLFLQTIHGRYLQKNGFGKDLEYCAQKDVFKEVPEFLVETGEIVLART
jgi:2-phosphosulfolactate phosphatase